MTGGGGAGVSPLLRFSFFPPSSHLSSPHIILKTQLCVCASIEDIQARQSPDSTHPSQGYTLPVRCSTFHLQRNVTRNRASGRGSKTKKNGLKRGRGGGQKKKKERDKTTPTTSLPFPLPSKETDSCDSKGASCDSGFFGRVRRKKKWGEERQEPCRDKQRRWLIVWGYFSVFFFFRERRSWLLRSCLLSADWGRYSDPSVTLISVFRSDLILFFSVLFRTDPPLPALLWRGFAYSGFCFWLTFLGRAW